MSPPDPLKKDPAILAVSPGTAKQYDVVAVQITGENTHFDATTFISFSGAGITPSNVSAVNLTHLSATLTIAPEAALAVCDVTAVTGAEVAPGLAMFTVEAAPPATISVSPDSALRGTVATMEITGVNTHFGAHTVVSFAGQGITVSSRTVLTPTTLSVTVTIDETAELRTSDVVVTSGPEVATGGSFTVQYNPDLVKILYLDPGVAAQGSSDLIVQIHGQHTNWDETSVVSFAGQGITLSAFHTVDPTFCKATISVDVDAEVGKSDVTVTTGLETAPGVDAFLVMVSTTKAVALREAVNTYLRQNHVEDPATVAMCEGFIANVDQAMRIETSGVLVTVGLKGGTA